LCKKEYLVGRKTSDDAVLNATLVLTSEHPEEAVISPVGVPRVSDDPIGCAAVNAPTKDLDGVSTNVLARGVAIDTRLVGEEVLIDIEGSLDGSILHDFSLNLRNAVDRVGRFALVAILSIGGTRPGLVGALAGAVGGVVLLGGARILRPRHVVVAAGEGIRIARLFDDALALPVLPDR
jgi:hypothetical protein